MEGVADPPKPMFFIPLRRDPAERAQATIHVRVDGHAGAVIPSIRAALRTIDPDLPYLDVHPIGDNLAQQFAPWRMAGLVTGIFAGLALLLSTVGLYGVIAFLTEQRTREIGVRVALGADARRIARMVLAEGAGVATLGCLAGALASLALARLIRARLFGVSPADPLTYIVVAALLGTAALLASYLPARRAARVQPTQALRYE